MKIVSFKEIVKENTVLALGYFDSVHIGHKVLLKNAVLLSKKLNATPTALIFTGNFKGNGEVFSFTERIKRLENEGIERVVYAELTGEFLKTSSDDFINVLFKTINVKALVCGEDFTYGKNALGNVKTLLEKCNESGVELSVVNKVVDNSGNKISTYTIKNLLLAGNVKKANELLGDNYVISGEVIKGKRLGNVIGFPTANIKIDESKTPLKRGVYKTEVIINGVKYKAITNVGTQPTVNGNNEVIETYINDYCGDLYGVNLTVYFIDFMRDIIKFNSVEELKAQLLEDKRSLYD